MKILFGVFDWGLGHATRDIPIIEELLKRGDKVDIISTGRALKLLKSYLKNKCRYFDVRSVYSPFNDSNFLISFITSIPRMIISLKQARKETEKIIEKNKYDKVISDCRYDVYDRKENSILINHQLSFKSPILESIVARILAMMMNHFGTIAVPDYNSRKLSGELGKNKYYSGKVCYIGILSRLKKRKLKQDIDYFISMSGPEPQRTILENKILGQISSFKGKIVIAGGNLEINKKTSRKNLKFFSFLDKNQQEEMMNRAKFIITRSGYSTLLELAELEKKKALLIPFPKQTEQEYVADLYEKEKLFHHVHQDKLDLKKDIENCKNFKGFHAEWKTKDSVRKFMRLL
jgi:uncharacterized protein (TIGR00661 family)